MKCLHTVLGLSTVLIFLLDISTPIGVAVWLFYFVPLILASRGLASRSFLAFCLICSGLIALGGVWSQASELPVEFAIENRISSILVLFFLAYSLNRNRSLMARLELQKENLTMVNRDLRSFSYSVSHDLKNPLQTILGFTNLLREQLSSKIPDEEREYLGRIDQQGKHMLNIINDLLKLSSLTDQPIRLERVNLSAIARASAEQLSHLNPGRNVRFEIQPDLMENADQGLMRLLFDNLIANALKFTSKTDRAFIQFGTQLQKNQTVYFVRDNGVGFDQSQADRLFEPFARFHSQDEFAGTGIGLSIVRRVIERHGGTVWAHSEIGKGAAIFFTLSSRQD